MNKQEESSREENNLIVIHNLLDTRTTTLRSRRFGVNNLLNRNMSATLSIFPLFPLLRFLVLLVGLLFLGLLLRKVPLP